MKIALIHFRIAQVGGLETRLKNYLHYFTQRGDEVTIVHARQDMHIQLPDRVHLHKINCRWIPKPLRMWWFGKHSASFLQQSQFDLSLSLGRTPGQQLLICPGTHIGYLQAMHIQVPSPVDYLNIYLDRQAFRTSGIILSASRMIAREVTGLYRIAQEKVQTLYPPSDPDVFNFSLRRQRLQLQRALGIAPHKKSFLFVSSGHQRKGLPLLLQIFSSLRSKAVHLYIAGAPVKYRLPDNVSFLGFTPDMQKVYPAVDALIHPAAYEPFGQIVSESLMCGTPVIVSQKTGAAELVQPDEGLVIPSFKPADWQQAIERFCDMRLTVKEGFAERNRLTPAHHLGDMLEIWSKARSRQLI
ncbi:MAG: LPS biosynthesis-like protein [Chitinophagales bacterium]|nr:MAG: LPS biosynthesis-like protein [Chitinophagales bacterium]